MPSFNWEDIDHTLVQLKTTDLAERMHKSVERAEACIRHKNSGNLNDGTVPTLILRMKQGSADRFARRIYAIYCDVWQTQGYPKSAAFIRAICSQAVVPAIRARANAITGEFAMFAWRTNFSPEIADAMLKSLDRDMQRLQSRWERRLEAEAKECEHAERRRLITTSRPVPLAGVSVLPPTHKTLPIQDTGAWKDLGTEFSQLATEEAQGARVKDYLQAFGSYKRGAVIRHDLGRPEAGPFCLLKTPECGIWNFSSGISENFRERFRTAAARAGLALGCPEDIEAEDFWLHSLFSDMIENGSKLLLSAKRGEGGAILRVCEASATFCARLERKTLSYAIRTIGKTTHRRRISDAAEPTGEQARAGVLKPSSEGVSGQELGGSGSRLNGGKPGRKPKLSQDFVVCAGRLWRKAILESKTFVSFDQLREIASALDAAAHVPPADYLEGKYAKEVREFNSRHSNSKIGPLLTWSKLVSHRDKDHIQGMRRLLARCAEKVARNQSAIRN